MAFCGVGVNQSEYKETCECSLLTRTAITKIIVTRFSIDWVRSTVLTTMNM